MIKYNKEAFFSRYKLLFGKINHQQTDGLDFLLTKLNESKRIDSVSKAAYVLATIKWETTHTFQPITEYGSEAYLKSKKYYPFIGRGYVQLTWRDNYKKFGDALGIDLVKNPGLANEPEIAWQILEMGMTDNFGVQDPDFTNYTLENYFYNNHYDFVNARKIINPKDYKSYQPIAEIAEKFYECLLGSIITEKDIIEAKGLM